MWIFPYPFVARQASCTKALDAEWLKHIEIELVTSEFARLGESALMTDVPKCRKYPPGIEFMSRTCGCRSEYITVVGHSGTRRFLCVPNCVLLTLPPVLRRTYCCLACSYLRPRCLCCRFLTRLLGALHAAPLAGDVTGLYDNEHRREQRHEFAGVHATRIDHASSRAPPPCPPLASRPPLARRASQRRRSSFACIGASNGVETKSTAIEHGTNVRFQDSHIVLCCFCVFIQVTAPYAMCVLLLPLIVFTFRFELPHRMRGVTVVTLLLPIPVFQIKFFSRQCVGRCLLILVCAGLAGVHRNTRC